MPWMSWRSISSSMARVLLVEDGDGVAFLYGLPLGDLDFFHLPGPRRLDWDLHLHGLQHDHGIARGHRVADLARDLEDHARDVRLDVFSHRTLLARPSGYGCAPRGTPYWPSLAGETG